MDGVVVKRYLREEEGDDDKKYYLCRLSLNYEGDDKKSLTSVKDFSVSEICKLSDFKDGAKIYGYSCHDWMCFHTMKGQFVVYNITTKEVKHLPPYKSRRLNNPNWVITYRSSGMGYDPHSDDYKVVRSFTEYHRSSVTVCRADLYSLKTGSLKSIPIAGTQTESINIDSICRGVYVGGRYYWSTTAQVECFDFTDETYSVIPGPPHGYKFPAFCYILVKCRGHLGIILSRPRLEECEYWMRPQPACESRLQVSKPSSCERSSNSSSKRRTFEVWVWNDVSSWTKLYDAAALPYVVKPLCLIDDRITFFQGETRDSKCELMIYDWITKEMKKFNIRDYPGHMQVFSGFELPPDPISPMNGLYTGEEIKTDKAWLRPHNASLKRKKTGTKTTESKTMCVGQNASSTAKWRRKSRRRAKGF